MSEPTEEMIFAGMAIMPVRLTEKMIEAALPVLMREDDEDKHRALGQLICVWDALIDAALKNKNDRTEG